jgi:hypothetical protein
MGTVGAAGAVGDAGADDAGADDAGADDDADGVTLGSEHPATTAASTTAAPGRVRSLETGDTALPNPFRTSTP